MDALDLLLTVVAAELAETGTIKPHLLQYIEVTYGYTEADVAALLYHNHGIFMSRTVF